MAVKKISQRYAADLEKRRQKGSIEVLKKVFDFDDRLIKEIGPARRRAIVKAFGDAGSDKELTNRDLFSAALATNLIRLLDALIDLGLVDNRPKDARKPRPRPVDDACWELLMQAARLVDLPGTFLLRACVHLLSGETNVEVDLRAVQKKLDGVAKRIDGQRRAAAAKKDSPKSRKA